MYSQRLHPVLALTQLIHYRVQNYIFENTITLMQQKITIVCDIHENNPHNYTFTNIINNPTYTYIRKIINWKPHDAIPFPKIFDVSATPDALVCEIKLLSRGHRVFN